MPKIIVSGCNGRMGQVVTRMCTESKDCTIVAGLDVNTEQKNDYPVYADPMEYQGSADAVVDFSNPAALSSLLSWCRMKKIPIIICTTGHSDEQLEEIKKAANDIPIFRSGNMSVGINLLAVLLKKASAVLGDSFDVEIVERHHRMKLDAPSGTAIMLADAVASALPHDSQYVYERHSVRRERSNKEIGISSIRGGTIVGEHEVIFAGSDEIIELKHTALSREIFANGAITAARYMAAVKTPGIYDMNDALSEMLSK